MVKHHAIKRYGVGGGGGIKALTLDEVAWSVYCLSVHTAQQTVQYQEQKISSSAENRIQIHQSSCLRHIQYRD